MPDTIAVNISEGRDAYQIAVAEGFEGNRAAWLASLQGEQGDPGADAVLPATPTFDNVRTTPGTLTYSSTVNLDLSGKGIQELALTGNVTFTTSNRAAGRSITVFIDSDASTRNLTFPAWKFMGAAAPTTIAANKTATLTITARSTTDGSLVAAYAVEP